MMNVPSCHFFAWAIKKKEWYVIIFQQPVKNNLVSDLHLNYMWANGNFPCPHTGKFGPFTDFMKCPSISNLQT